MKDSKKQSTNREMFSVGALLDDTIGLPGLPDLCIFGKTYNLAVHGWCGIRKSLVCLLIFPE